MKTRMFIAAATIILLAFSSLPTCTNSLRPQAPRSIHRHQHPVILRPSSSSRWIGGGSSSSSSSSSNRIRKNNSRLYVVNPPPNRRRTFERTTANQETADDDGTSISRVTVTRRKALSTDNGLDLSSAFSFPARNAPAAATKVEDTTHQRSIIQTTAPENQEAPTKYVMLGLLWCIACLSALDRVAMSVALLPMSMEFDFTDSIKGSISSLFSVGYGIAILPAGLLVANLSPRRVMAIGLTIWSVATIATPLAVGSSDGGGSGAGATMAALLGARALVGAGESVILPTIQRLLSTWTSAKEKSTALATVYSGFQAGTIAAYVLSPTVMDSLGGWRGLFYCYGAIGLAILVPWLLLAQDKPSEVEQQQQQQRGLSSFKPFTQAPKTIVHSEESWERAMEGAMTTVREAPWTEFRQSKGAWALMLAHCAKNWGLYIALGWMPTFFSEQYDIGVKDSAWLSVLPSIAGAVCGLVVGKTADSFLQKLETVPDEMKSNVRKGFQSFAFLGQSFALGSLALHIPDDPVVAQTFFLASFGLMGFNLAGFEAGIQDKAGEKWAGLLYSATSLPAVMAGTFGVYFTGLLLDMTNQDWSVIFGLNAAVNVLGTVAFITLYDSKREFD